jgi:hypothetical protein
MRALIARHYSLGQECGELYRLFLLKLPLSALKPFSFGFNGITAIGEQNGKFREESKDQKDKQEMLKDVLRRSSKKERQEYTAIVDRQIAIGKRLAEIESEQEELIERFDKNEYPKDMRISKTKERTIDEIKEMSNEEAAFLE